MAPLNLTSSWPGLSRPSTSSLRNYWIKVIPVRIAGDNHSDLPRARPMLDIVFALDGITDVVEFLEVNQPLQAVLLGKAIDESRAMFEDSAKEIVCHPDIKDAIWSIGQNINVATRHAEILQDVDGRDKPGHDEIKCCHELA
jgi:hypothetical protein